ncbi:hypothetical protein MMC21_005950 [Puttea exsequens]|nr:hypothetical protein [Puttea exsequens]
MHALLTLVHTHNHLMTTQTTPHLPPLPTHHYALATTLFSRALSSPPPLPPPSLDALWFTSMLLGILSFAHIEAPSPPSAWPLAAPSPLDLNWLQMFHGKHEVWKLAQPHRRESALKPLNGVWLPRPPPVPAPELSSLPPAMVALLGLSPASAAFDNPYRQAASALAKILERDDPQSTILGFLSCMGTMESGFKALLEMKDARALLVLGWWFAKVCRTRHWYMWRRTALEGAAIVLFLERVWRGDGELMGLLVWPRGMCTL